ncbi:hypothetical protein AYL99_07656 [Fonsecaea erecta]|uniref:Uncharacterized protein n=1 Tax=Fonsecaea erecta TaxID=1367422 RepID=A0A178ZGI7_9EURO|nr:hypothetical protein AYL99_07656 [Fonsecaea erecta]OAP58566.1 hypothetical protein AYL99_07656 [Fonsecaea erecta]
MRPLPLRVPPAVEHVEPHPLQQPVSLNRCFRSSRAISYVNGQRYARNSVDDVAYGVENIRLGTQNTPPATPTPHTYLDPRSPSPNTPHEAATRSPRSASRRRSGSHVDLTHKVAEEEPPPSQFHAPEFQREFGHARNLVNHLVNVLASSSLHNETQSGIGALYQQAVALSRFQKPSTRTVGLVGDQGVGKSSVLNSLLDFKSFARSGNNGSACTCVATEYHYHEHADFAIEVEYFTLDELQDQLTELLQAYRHYHLPESNEKQSDLEEKAKVAEDTFRAAFRSHRTYNEEFLLDNPEATVLQTLLTWARNSGLPLRDTPGAGPEIEFFNEAEQCSDRLVEITSEPNSSNEASAWPFIRKIKVYLNAYILSKGLILVDLPGLRDLNSAWLRITERYLLECDEIFAICPIGRATTDASVREVFELARQASLSRVGIICTKSEEIQADEAQREFGAEAGTYIKKLRDRREEMQESLEEIERRISDLIIDTDTEAEGDKEERRKLARLQRAASKSRKSLEQVQFELKTFLITTRNQKVTAEIRAVYESRMPQGNLPVFCVSNREYWEHRKKPAGEAMPFLHLSGILEVRKHCLSVVAESQLRTAVDYMVNAIPGLLGSVELWVQSGVRDLSSGGKQAVRDTIERIEKALYNLNLSKSPVNASARTMEREFKTRIARIMKQHSKTWCKAAENATIEWRGWSSGTFSAFCRKYGDHHTTTIGTRHWNEEAIEAMVTQLATPWQTLRQNLRDLQFHLLETINDCFNRSIAISIEAETTADSLPTLTKNIEHRHALLVAKVEKLEDDFERGLSILQTDAFSGIHSSFIGQHMKPSYDKTILLSGTGSDIQRKRIIQEAFSDDQLFVCHRQQLQDRFCALARDLQDEIQDAIARHLADVQSDLDMLKNTHVALESEQHCEFRRRVEDTVQNIRQEMEEIHAVVAPSEPLAVT